MIPDHDSLTFLSTVRNNNAKCNTK